MRFNSFLLSFFLLFVVVKAYSQNHVITLKISDSKTLEAIPFASVTILQDYYLANESGEVFITRAVPQHSLIKTTCVGYKNKIDTFNHGKQTMQILLEQNAVVLKDVQVRSFTSERLASMLLHSFEKTKKLNKNTTGKMRTYSVENQSNLIEYVTTLQNINFSEGKLTDFSIKCGDICLNLTDIDNQFKSEAVNHVYLNTNPYYQRIKPTFINLFTAKNPKTLLKYYQVDFKYLDSHLIQIKLHHHYLNHSAAVVVDINKEEILQIDQNWYFSENYPLTTTFPNGRIIDTFAIKSSLYYHDGRWMGQSVHQSLTYQVKSKTDRIECISFLEIKDRTPFHLPIGLVTSNSDYTTILAMPVNRLMRKTLLHEEPSTKWKELSNEYPTLSSYKELLQFNAFSAPSNAIEIIQKMSLVSFWEPNWQLDWTQLNTPISQTNRNKTRIDIFIFGDFHCDSTNVEYTIEPLFNYNQSFYGSERNEEARFFIQLLFHLAKLKSLELHKWMKETYPSCPDYQVFKNAILNANKELAKELFLCKLQCNDGQNKEAFEKWKEKVSTKFLELGISP